jgi:hypothetical protein
MILTPANKLKKKPILLSVSRQVSVAHRWLGILLCLMLAMWFATGSVLSFVPFPSLSSAERIRGGEVIDTTAVSVDPAKALASAGAAFVEHFRLISVLGRPRYLLSLRGEPVLAVDAVNGKDAPPLTRDAARAVAEHFSGLAAAAIEGPFDYDQWVVHNAYDGYRPFYKVRMNDAAGTRLYVSVRSGEVIQRTRLKERAWNYVGAVSHWINLTILRKNYDIWHSVIWTLALGGVVLTLAGIWLGSIRYINLKRQRRPGLSPFGGWLRVHHSIGLFACILVLSWSCTGWLKLNIGTFFSSDLPSTNRIERLRGIALADAAKAFPASQLKKLETARDIEVTALAGRPLLLARNAHTQLPEVVFVDGEGSLSVAEVLPDDLLQSAVQSAWSPLGTIRLDHVAADDPYSLRVNPLPSTTRRIVLNDATQTWVQIDAASGQVVSVLDTSRRVYRWVVDGLHTFDFPMLNRVGSLWHVLLLTATTAGFAFSCTGIVIGAKRLRRSAAFTNPSP